MALSSSTRAETTADHLRQAIREGRYISGERLLEMGLAQELGVSQNTIRDALYLLESEGWVVKQARHGVYVRAFTKGEAEELYALVAAVEGLALRWAMNGLSKSGVTSLRRLTSEARKQALTGDRRGATDTLFSLHRLIATLGGKSQTIDLLQTLYNRVYLLEILREMRAPRSLHAHQAQIILYEKLVSLMERGQVDSAHQLLHYLLMDDCDTLLPLLG